MNGGNGPSIAGFKVLRHRDFSAAIAVDAAGVVTAGRFLADIQALARRLPEAGHIVNLCTDRYRFAVGFIAALLRRQITLLPPSEASSPLLALRDAYPELYFLCDGPSAASGVGKTLLFPRDLEAKAVDDAPEIPAHQPAAVLFTSGSTGMPMPHLRSWGAMVNSSRAAGRALGIAGSGDSPVVVGTVPHQHSYGLELIVVLALQHGLAFHRTRALLPGDIVAQLTGVALPPILVTTPIHLRSLMGHRGPLPQLNRIVCATAPLAPDLARTAEARFEAPLYEIYGCTEIGQMAVRRTVESLEWKCIDGVVLTQRDGDVWASGDATATEAPLNDIIELVDRKRFILKDRKSDVVNIAGKRSSLGYLNHHLNAIDGVQDGVFGVPEDGGRLAAYVVAPGRSSAQILTALRRHLDPAFLPRPIHFVDTLPRNPVGKLTRQALSGLSGKLSGTDEDWFSQAYRFPPDHPTGAGHFPGNPIIPGALLLDRMLHVIGQPPAIGTVQEIKVAKFLRPVRPGDAVTFRWRPTRPHEFAFECRLSDGDDIALTGTVSMEAA